MPSPEGYRKAQRLMRQAEKFGRPIFTFIDTPGTTGDSFEIFPTKLFASVDPTILNSISSSNVMSNTFTVHPTLILKGVWATVAIGDLAYKMRE